jgi:hypothetical protein
LGWFGIKSVRVAFLAKFLFVVMFSFRLECAAVERTWCPAVACPMCTRANDFDFCFCQACGYRRPLIMENVPRVNVDEDFIRSRREQLATVRKEFSYGKAKEAEYLSFVSFLASREFPKQPLEANPEDVIDFLIFKEKNGQTQYHVLDCALSGLKGVQQCGCRVGIAKGSLQVIISKLKTSLEVRGLSSPWNMHLGKGNPVDSAAVVAHKKLIDKESASAGVVPNRACPVWSHKIRGVCEMLLALIYDPPVEGESPLQRLIYAHDAFYLTCQMKAGRRCADFSHVLANACLLLPDGSGMVFNVFWHKTIRSGSEDTICLLRDPDATMDVICWFHRYKRMAAGCQLPLGSGFLFRHLTPWGVYDASIRMDTGTMNARFTGYLRKLGLDEGETIGGIRSGAGAQFLLSGVALHEVMGHQNWKTERMAKLYSQCTLVLAENNLSNTEVLLEEEALRVLTDKYDELNRLSKDFCIV